MRRYPEHDGAGWLELAIWLTWGGLRLAVWLCRRLLGLTWRLLVNLTVIAFGFALGFLWVTRRKT